MPSAVPCNLSLILSLVPTLLFSRTGYVLSHRNSSTHRLPRFPPRNLCSLVTVVVFSLVFAATDTASVKLLSLKDWQNRGSFLQHLWTLVPGYLSFCTVQLRTICAARSSVTLCLSLRPLIQALGSCPVSEAPWSSAMPSSIGRGRVTATTKRLSSYL